MGQAYRPAFRFLDDEEFSALNVKGKALYLHRAEQELEVQRGLLHKLREDLTVQVAAMIELSRPAGNEPDSAS